LGGCAAGAARLDTIAADPFAHDVDDLSSSSRACSTACTSAASTSSGSSRRRAPRAPTRSWPTRSRAPGTATAEVSETVADEGLDGLRPLLHEWRGALFRVRLARLRLAAPAPTPAEPVLEPEHYPLVRPVAAFLLALCGAVAFAGGATLGYWPIWAAGLLAVGGGMLTYRP
jgi:hypothetical protein